MRLVRHSVAIVSALSAALSLQAQSTAVPALSQALPNQALSAGGAAPTVDLRNYFTIAGVTGQVAQFNTVLGKFNAVLLSSAAPKNVANFLNYVNRGAYTNSFIHRSVPGFVIQGGGFGVANNSLTAIATDPPVVNEFKVSNTRGTLAMAKTSAGPDTATNQWFVNLADNSGNLDNQNGGFTVFASVLGTGMSVADAIAGVTVYDASATLGATFNQLPLLGSALTVANLITVYSIKVVPLFPAAQGDDAVATFSAVSSNTGIATATLAGSGLTLTPVAAGSATITVTATDVNGNVATGTFTVTVTATAPPAITVQPQGHTVAVGSTAVFGVDATGTGVGYQWLKGGTAITGATASRLILSNSQPGDAGSYSVRLTNANGSVTSNSATLSVVTTANPGRLVNLSIRGPSGTGSNVLIMGVVTGGDGTGGNTNLLIRGVGPSIIPAPFNVTDALPDPAIQVSAFPSGTVVASNDNWSSAPALTAAATATGAFPLLPNSLDAALVSAFPRGLYSILVSGNNATTGSVLGEIYDTGYPATYNPAVPRLINISTRTYLSAANTLTAGFVIFGDTAQTVLIRGIGPNKPFADVIGAANVLPDPRLDLYHSGVRILANDNWGGDPQLTTIGNAVGAQALTDPNSKDAVLLVTLDPGVYSAIDLGVNGASGITLIEVYAVP